MTPPVPSAAGTQRRIRTLPFAALLMAGCLAGPARAQQTLLTPNYRDADIRAVAEEVQAVIGRPIILDPRVRAQVTVINSQPMTADAFYRLFLATLEVNNFIAQESGGAITVVPDANARTGQGDDFVTQAIVLNNIGAAQLVPLLRPLLPQSAHLAALPSSNALIVADRPQNFRRISELVRRMDQDGRQEIEVIALENAGAEEVVRLLSQLNQAAQAAGGAPPVQVIADTRTNSVLLSGPPAPRLEYRALITHLDTPSAEGGDTLVVYLQYADAEDLATKLQAQFGGGGSGGGAPAAEGAPPGTPNAGPVTIWADAGTNALVINAPERVRQDMLAVVKQIDIVRWQVMVEAIIVEMTVEKAAELGITWAVGGDDEAAGLTNFSATTGGILQLGAASQGDEPDPGLIRDGLTLGLGRVRDSGTSWAAIVSALRGDADTNIVSLPTIITLDNEEAEIKVGQEVPFLTGQFTNTGASSGSVNPFQTIQREEVGTRLKITPQINEGNGVRLTIEQETSSISQGAAGAVDIVTNSRTITTHVFVHDGDVLILGGLIDDQLRQGEQRVPGLGRIPGLGWLFRARRSEHTKTNLMVFIRPTILKDRYNAAIHTNAKYRDVQELQRQMGQNPVRLLRNEPQPAVPPFPDNVIDTPDAEIVSPPDVPIEEPDGGEPR